MWLKLEKSPQKGKMEAQSKAHGLKKREKKMKKFLSKNGHFGVLGVKL